MKTFSLFAVAVALGIGTASMLLADQQNQLSRSNAAAAAQITDAAFRDGLYLGRLAAEGGAKPHVAIGRWATLEDRSSFATGYRQGHSESLASRVAPIAGGRLAE
jgi:hypothetical protein